MFHAMIKVAREEGLGVRGIMKGVEASALREGTYSTMRVGLYEPIKRVIGADEPDSPGWKKFLAGAMANWVPVILCNPLCLTKTRMQSQPAGEYNTMRWHIRDTYNTRGGVKGFYQGVSANLIRGTAVGSTYLSSYETSKHAIKRRGILQEGLGL